MRCCWNGTKSSSDTTDPDVPARRGAQRGRDHAARGGARLRRLGPSATTPPSRPGRLSLNPLAHVDRVGTILLPGVLLLAQLAHPRPGRASCSAGPSRSRSPPEPLPRPAPGHDALVAARRAADELLRWPGSARSRPGMGLTEPIRGRAAPGHRRARHLGRCSSCYNLALGLFNLLPIPPLDGGRIAVGHPPAACRARVMGAARSARGIFIVVLLVYLLPAGAARRGGRHPLRSRARPALNDRAAPRHRPRCSGWPGTMSADGFTFAAGPETAGPGAAAPDEAGSLRDRPDAGLLLHLDGFEGPLDLLLELARAQKVDLAGISILSPRRPVPRRDRGGAPGAAGTRGRLAGDGRLAGLAEVPAAAAPGHRRRPPRREQAADDPRRPAAGPAGGPRRWPPGSAGAPPLGLDVFRSRARPRSHVGNRPLPPGRSTSPAWCAPTSTALRRSAGTTRPTGPCTGRLLERSRTPSARLAQPAGPACRTGPALEQFLPDAARVRRIARRAATGQHPARRPRTRPRRPAAAAATGSRVRPHPAAQPVPRGRRLP